ncbi:alpha/beta fold hydrolase [Nonomuraea sp. SBT364]|uniref:alpha/beta fold hydrolase n=1 Tax=Nonomuraea sp. SBT364 TaxID=1580530 RepID=UPI00066CAF0C|nr:alpha/beta hydrolase [Nonomuraea sp. SBT364]
MLTIPTADGAGVRAADEGRGPAVLVLHAGLDDGSQWHKVARLLSPRHRVVRLHRRQYRPDLRPRCTMAQEAGDVLAAAAALGGPVLLVGHSSGGVAALEAMAAAPGAFAGAVLYEPPVVTGLPLGGRAAVRARAAVDAGRPGKAIEIFVRDVVGVPPFASRLIGLYVAAAPRMRALVPRQIDDLEAIDELGDRLDAYAAIETPVVLLGGDRSPAHLGDRLDALERRLPHPRRVTLRGQGHGAHLRAPAEVARVIETLAGL